MPNLTNERIAELRKYMIGGRRAQAIDTDEFMTLLDIAQRYNTMVKVLWPELARHWTMKTGHYWGGELSDLLNRYADIVEGKVTP